MNTIKILETQDIKLDHDSLFKSEESRDKYLKMNNEFCSYQNGVLVTDKTVTASAWYKINYKGIVLSFHIRSNFLLKLHHDTNTNLVHNRVMDVIGNEHVISVHEVDDSDYSQLPFLLDHLYHYANSEFDSHLLEIVNTVINDFKQRVHIAVSYYFIDLCFYSFQKCQQKIIEKVVDEKVGCGWENYLACAVDESASHYLHSCLYPEPQYSGSPIDYDIDQIFGLNGAI